MDARDRAVGSVLGLALGDALGAPFEFRRSHQVPSPLPAFVLPWMGLPPGTTTDDTAMARNLIRSLIANDARLDTADVLRRHIAWLATDPPDVGNLTRQVLSRAGEDPEGAAREYVEQRGPEVSAGNGSVMYCAPLGVAYANRPDELVDAAPALSAITHWDERCRTACLAVTLAVAALVRGEDPHNAVVGAVGAVSGRVGVEELELMADSAGLTRPIDGPDQGFVLYAAGVALRVVAVAPAGLTRPIDGPDQGFVLYAAGVALRVVAVAPPFEDGVRQVVALGGDTDTNAAVTGALLGALHGREGLPQDWLAKLVDREDLEADAEALARFAS